MTFGASQTNLKGVTSSEQGSRRVFDRALEAGINLVDTANVYTEGRSEELTGEWAAGKRDQLLIATKCRFPLGFGMTHKPGPNEWGLSRKAIMTACEGSLRRLKTEVIDLYQVHMQDSNVAIDETLRALDDLVTEGKVRYIGCANYAGYSLVESLWAADRLRTHRYESIQLQRSLVRRSAERELPPRRRLGSACSFGLPSRGAFYPENTSAADRRRRDPASMSIRTRSRPWTPRRTGLYSTWSAELRNSMKLLMPPYRSPGSLLSHKRPASSSARGPRRNSRTIFARSPSSSPARISKSWTRHHARTGIIHGTFSEMPKRATRSSWLDEPQWTTRRRCRAAGVASDFVKAGLTDECKKQQGARLATARGHSSGRDSDLPAVRLQENIHG